MGSHKIYTNVKNLLKPWVVLSVIWYNKISEAIWTKNICEAGRTHAKAEPSQYNRKIRGCYLITKSTIYTDDTIQIRRHKETRSSLSTIY